ncbi:acetylglutamate kinase [Flaviflexus ciconiae]|uniref:Acetylglutamate kinase n=1 Tax=Flaviflexus ciconiae TaxID=2496867 RepID=A0A3Q9G636_9ACTO|nr:acetylglutamate kinase [Flaviflexus ciconiae]AZQ76657.1 acetylglutamate kinase [Flaviflexus ciconiae]
MSSLLQRLLAAQDKAEVLVQALPWIREFAGQTIVVKYGGNAMVNDELKQAFVHDIMFFHHVGLKPVVVHGGGPQINSMLKRLGIESEFRGGLRVTTPEAMEVVRMVLAGQVQRELVSLINQDAPYAVGMSGEDAGLLKGRKRYIDIDGQKVDLGQVGDVHEVNPASLHDLIDNGRIPVVSTIAMDIEGDGILNVNADTAAAAIASALGANKLLMLTDVEGLYLDWPNKDSLVSEINASELAELLPKLDAGMKPKMEAALHAIDAGVQAAHIIDGRMAHSMLLEIFTDAGVGTRVTKDEK